MRGLMRLLMMFGPMIFRQVQKYQRNKARQQPTQYPDRQIDRGPRSNRDRNYDRGESQHRGRDDRGEYVEYKDLNAELNRKKEEQLSPEERDFKLKEDEIMLDKSDLRHFQGDIAKAETGDLNVEDVEEAVKTPKKKLSKDDLDLKDLFLDK